VTDMDFALLIIVGFATSTLLVLAAIMARAGDEAEERTKAEPRSSSLY